jgi:hypothetical protein
MIEFKQRTLKQIADMICGNFQADESLFRYRSSSFLTEFFYDCDTDYAVSLRWRPPGNDLAVGDSCLRSGSMVVSTI